MKERRNKYKCCTWSVSGQNQKKNHKIRKKKKMAPTQRLFIVLDEKILLSKRTTVLGDIPFTKYGSTFHSSRTRIAPLFNPRENQPICFISLFHPTPSSFWFHISVVGRRVLELSSRWLASYVGQSYLHQELWGLFGAVVISTSLGRKRY